MKKYYKVGKTAQDNDHWNCFINRMDFEMDQTGLKALKNDGEYD